MRAASRNKHKAWSSTDDDALRRWYPTLPTKQVAAILCRTAGSVYVRANLLGLAKAPGYYGTPTARRARSTQGSRFWSEAENALLRSLYATTTAIDIAARMKRGVMAIYAQAKKLGLAKDPAFLASHSRMLAMRPDHPMRKHRFPKGHVPFSKGLKGFYTGGRSSETWFKKGQPNARWKDDYPVGSLRLNADGYVDMKVREGYRAWDAFHRILWEDAHGPVPKGFKLVFKDGDRLHLDVSNLELITHADLMRRNTIHNLPAPLKSTIQVLGQLKRRIREKQDRGLEGPPVRHAGRAARQGKPDGSGPRKDDRGRGSDDREFRQG